MKSSPLSVVQDGVVVVIKNTVPSKVKLSLPDGVYLFQYNSPLSISVFSLIPNVTFGIAFSFNSYDTQFNNVTATGPDGPYPIGNLGVIFSISNLVNHIMIWVE